MNMEIRFHFHSSHLNCAPCMHLVSHYVTRVKYIGKGISQCSKNGKIVQWIIRVYICIYEWLHDLTSKAKSKNLKRISSLSRPLQSRCSIWKKNSKNVDFSLCGKNSTMSRKWHFFWRILKHCGYVHSQI